MMAGAIVGHRRDAAIPGTVRCGAIDDSNHGGRSGETVDRHLQSARHFCARLRQTLRNCLLARAQFRITHCAKLKQPRGGNEGTAARLWGLLSERLRCYAFGRKLVRMPSSTFVWLCAATREVPAASWSAHCPQ